MLAALSQLVSDLPNFRLAGRYKFGFGVAELVRGRRDRPRSPVVGVVHGGDPYQFGKLVL